MDTKTGVNIVVRILLKLNSEVTTHHCSSAQNYICNSHSHIRSTIFPITFFFFWYHHYLLGKKIPPNLKCDLLSSVWERHFRVLCAFKWTPCYVSHTNIRNNSFTVISYHLTKALYFTKVIVFPSFINVVNTLKKNQILD